MRASAFRRRPEIRQENVAAVVRRLSTLWIALTFAALLALPLQAAAHTATTPIAATPLELGPYTARLESVPTPAYANGNVTLVGLVKSASAEVPSRAQLFVAGPDGAWTELPLHPDERGLFNATFFAKTPGEHTARIAAFTADDREFQDQVRFNVYPDLVYRIWPANPIQDDPPVGRPYRVAVAIVDHVTEEPALDVADMSMRIERWSDDGATLVSTADVAMHHEGLGTWSGNYTFEAPTFYQVEFRSDSGRFEFGEFPPMPLYAKTRKAPAQSSGTPGAPIALALLSIAAVAVLSRRR